MVKFMDIQAITMQHAEEYEAAAKRVIESGWYLQGRENETFERDYAQYIGTQHCIAVANGLDALRLILRGYKELGVMKDGDEIIVPANTYIATILAITDNQLVPVLVEPTWEHLELDIDKVEEAITPRTKGVMTVHLYGRIAYNDQLSDICRRHGLKLMEDCAQSHGCTWKGIRTGALGDAGAHSFYPGKNLGAFGDAGAVTTDDEELAFVIRALANYGSQKKYVFRYTGLNSLACIYFRGMNRAHDNKNGDIQKDQLPARDTGILYGNDKLPRISIIYITVFLKQSPVYMLKPLKRR